MTTDQRFAKILTANADMLAHIDRILNGAEEAPSKEHDTRLVSITDTAKMLDLGRPTIYRLIKSGKLRTVSIFGHPRVSMQSIYDFTR